MQDKLQGVESPTPVTERRTSPRLRTPSLVYVELGKLNGGIVTCINGNGLALTAAATLSLGEQNDGPLRMQIYFPGFQEGIEASGQIVWKSASGKEAGIRFVDLSPDTQERIRNWISAQALKNEVRFDQGDQMQPPATKPGKAPGPRVSFADVASSRLGVDDPRSADFFKGGSGTEPPTSPAMKSGAFADATQVVASAFESPAFAQEQKTTHASREEQQLQTTLYEEGPRQQPASIRERRLHVRRPILLFTHVVLGEDNGGLVFNLSEGGLALTAAAPLREQHFDQIRVRFPDSEDWIDAKGRLAWVSGSGKEAGIEFVGLARDARARIREWVSQQESGADSQPQEQSYISHDAPAAKPRELPRPFDEPARIHPPRGAALFASGINGVFARAAARKRVAKSKPPRPLVYSARPPRRIARKALAAAALFALFGAGWILWQRSRWNEISGNAARTEPYVPIPGLERNTEVAEAKPPADPTVHAMESAPLQPNTAERATPSAEAGAERGPKEKVSRENTSNEKTLNTTAAVDHRAANPVAHASQAATQNKVPMREVKTSPPQIVAPTPARPAESKPVENQASQSKIAEIKAAENKPVQTAEALPIQNQNLNASLPALNVSLAHAEPPPPARANIEKEKPLAAPKQPEAMVTRTPLVTVSFDPFPSIRLPNAENPKKSRQGKSLQMGRLVQRVDPVYPEEAKQQGIEGAVKVHAIFGRQGTVESLIPVSGPPLLMPAAMNAVRQWRYSQTILGGQPMETEEEVTVEFRLSSGASKN